MKFTYNWLCSHIDTKLSPLEIKESLIDLGLELEDYINYQEKFADFTVAYIKDAVKHPNADSLRICQVETKTGMREIVCGAPNARKGIKVVFADEGAYIPGTGITLKKASIRGVESSGMMLSERELSLSDNHDSIIELQEDAVVGESVLPYMGIDDVMYDVSITLNRAYALGVRGIAKDLVSFGKGTLKPLNYKEITRELEELVKIEADVDICSYFNAVLVKGVNNNIKTPNFVANRLQMIGIKQNSALVDIANYLTIDLNQPFHIYDYDKIENNLSVRFAKEGEQINGLDGKEYKLNTSTPLICSANQPVCIAGIMGGLDSSCTKETTNILIECAHFNNDVVLNSASSLGISSESSYRYSRFVNKQEANNSLNLLLSMVSQYCGGSFGKTAVFGSCNQEENIIEFSVDFVNRLTGLTLSATQVKEMLTKLDFKVEEKQDNLLVKVPSYRFDVKTPNCLVEELVRLYGIENIEPKKPNHSDICIAFNDHKENDLSQDLSNIFANSGLQEVVNMSFICPDYAKTLGIYNKQLELLNPISSKLAIMRASILPSLLNTYLSNSNKGNNNIKIFEAGDVYNFDLKNKQELQVAFLLAGNNKKADAFEKPRLVDVYDAKGLLFNALESLGIDGSKLTYVKNGLPAYYHSAKSTLLGFGAKNIVACFGELHPKVKQQLDIKDNIIICEIFTERLTKFIKPSKNNDFVSSKFMPLTRDFAFLVDESVEALQFIKVAKSASKLITDVNIFDIYKGKNLEDGKKSVAFSVTIQPKENTLKGEEIEAICNTIISGVESKLNGQLRA